MRKYHYIHLPNDFLCKYSAMHSLLQRSLLSLTDILPPRRLFLHVAQQKQFSVTWKCRFFTVTPC